MKLNKQGLTLMEIIVVIGLAVFLMMIIYSSFLISSKSFYLSDNRLEIIQNGRVLLDRLSRELRQNVEVVTALPATKNDPLFPPPSEIIFQDGHETEIIQYLRYFLSNNSINRQQIAYFFPNEPGIYVYWNAVDQFGNPPQSQILDERIIAEYITNWQFYGEEIINIDVYLAKKDTTLHLFTSIYGRNQRE